MKLSRFIQVSYFTEKPGEILAPHNYFVKGQSWLKMLLLHGLRTKVINCLHKTLIWKCKREEKETSPIHCTIMYLVSRCIHILCIAPYSNTYYNIYIHNIVLDIYDTDIDR